MVQECFLLQMLPPAWTSALPGAGCWPGSGRIKLRLPADVSIHVIRHQGIPLPLFTYSEKAICLLSIGHMMLLAGQTGYTLASTSVPTAVPSARKPDLPERRPAHKLLHTQQAEARSRS